MLVPSPPSCGPSDGGGAEPSSENEIRPVDVIDELDQLMSEERADAGHVETRSGPWSAAEAEAEPMRLVNGSWPSEWSAEPSEPGGDASSRSLAMHARMTCSVKSSRSDGGARSANLVAVIAPSLGWALRAGHAARTAVARAESFIRGSTMWPCATRCAFSRGEKRTKRKRRICVHAAAVPACSAARSTVWSYPAAASFSSMSATVCATDRLHGGAAIVTDGLRSPTNELSRVAASRQSVKTSRARLLHTTL